MGALGHIHRDAQDAPQPASIIPTTNNPHPTHLANVGSRGNTHATASTISTQTRITIKNSVGKTIVTIAPFRRREAPSGSSCCYAATPTPWSY